MQPLPLQNCPDAAVHNIWSQSETSLGENIPKGTGDVVSGMEMPLFNVEIFQLFLQ